MLSLEPEQVRDPTGQVRDHTGQVRDHTGQVRDRTKSESATLYREGRQKFTLLYWIQDELALPVTLWRIDHSGTWLFWFGYTATGFFRCSLGSRLCRLNATPGNNFFFAFDFRQFTYQTLRPTSSMNLTVLADPQSCLASVAHSGQARSLCVLHSGQSSMTCSGVWSASWHAHLAGSILIHPLIRCALSPQWPVRRRKMMVAVTTN
jgi:hypothetical protein